MPLNSFKRHENALRKAQQTMSRKTRFSKYWKKAKACVQGIHSRIGNACRDFRARNVSHALTFRLCARPRTHADETLGPTATRGSSLSCAPPSYFLCGSLWIPD